MWFQKKTINVCIAWLMITAVFTIFWSEVVIAEEVQTAPSTTAVALASPSAILMEASTGTVLFEKNPDEIRSPASITKIMTLILTFEAIEKGRIKLEDEVSTSAYAKSMGGSQVFLEEGEIQTVDTLIKCITVASGNDASVAMAEFIAGSESEFVNLMNEKAAALGMNNTHFIDCCGLSSDAQHHTTARDVAIMSRELITKYPDIYNYTKIWMEDITHVTRQGTKNFTLSSTNKLLKQYQWTTGLKTGSTNQAKYCFSATANKDGIDLIAVVMGAPDFKIRFSEARSLLEYGFAITKLYVDENNEKLVPVRVLGGTMDQVEIAPEGAFRYLDVTGADFSQIEKTYEFSEGLAAPVQLGTQAGRILYKLGGKEIGSVAIKTTQEVQKAYFIDYLKRVVLRFLI
ncbi:MAG: D-alanyl-D-alanine carboxypeptidase [Lachnospiraceae bacterium]|nr:D-alanyl-D-alanine carboxypeptidase [Lachnospiraceae bacterium]MCI9398498.1 D-alanyl-D-alanine carboxypeptidase [Lachnospiraceae bacterium]MCX4376681.1 D-alanyl-D-alanine carboxypeptidase [Lachnospiraceae bacterium]